MGSWIRYERYAHALGSAEASLEALIAGPPADPAVAAPKADGAEAAVVPITSLCYSGKAALQRALTLRETVRRALASGAPDMADVTELIQEVFDLVKLGLEQPE